MFHPTPCHSLPTSLQHIPQSGDPMSVPALEGTWRQASPGQYNLRGGAGARHAGLHEGNSPGHRAQVFQHDCQLHLQFGGRSGFYSHHGPSLWRRGLAEGTVRAGREGAPARGRPGGLWGNVSILLGTFNGFPRQVSHRWRESSWGRSTPWGRQRDIFFLLIPWIHPPWLDLLP